MLLDIEFMIIRNIYNYMPQWNPFRTSRKQITRDKQGDFTLPSFENQKSKSLDITRSKRSQISITSIPPPYKSRYTKTLQQFTQINLLKIFNTNRINQANQNKYYNATYKTREKQEKTKTHQDLMKITQTLFQLRTNSHK